MEPMNAHPETPNEAADAYESILLRLIDAAERGVRLTGHEAHKGGAKAFRAALDYYREFLATGAVALSQPSNGNPE